MVSVVKQRVNVIEGADHSSFSPFVNFCKIRPSLVQKEFTKPSLLPWITPGPVLGGITSDLQLQTLRSFSVCVFLSTFCFLTFQFFNLELIWMVPLLFGFLWHWT